MSEQGSLHFASLLLYCLQNWERCGRSCVACQTDCWQRHPDINNQHMSATKTEDFTSVSALQRNGSQYRFIQCTIQAAEILVQAIAINHTHTETRCRIKRRLCHNKGVAIWHENFHGCFSLDINPPHRYTAGGQDGPSANGWISAQWGVKGPFHQWVCLIRRKLTLESDFCIELMW